MLLVAMGPEYAECFVCRAVMDKAEFEFREQFGSIASDYD